jgi:hypothetical protein
MLLPIPHLLLFVPAAVLALLALTAGGVSAIVNFKSGSLLPRAVFLNTPPLPPELRPSAQIIYFKPRQTSLPSALNTRVRQRAMPR